ncbi:hypothetical protein SALB_05170 [Streptomyces noursei]|uniref:Uncharacterized protein n=1 Tax=Streptomyces noursei TaxID=1971 RepID=A0A401R434_STRNR|nr:hypothetical protein SALB_05170 [Streptomyces noursei]
MRAATIVGAPLFVVEVPVSALLLSLRARRSPRLGGSSPALSRAGRAAHRCSGRDQVEVRQVVGELSASPGDASTPRGALQRTPCGPLEADPAEPASAPWIRDLHPLRFPDAAMTYYPCAGPPPRRVVSTPQFFTRDNREEAVVNPRRPPRRTRPPPAGVAGHTPTGGARRPQTRWQKGVLAISAGLRTTCTTCRRAHTHGTGSDTRVTFCSDCAFQPVREAVAARSTQRALRLVVMRQNRRSRRPHYRPRRTPTCRADFSRLSEADPQARPLTTPAEAPRPRAT